MKYVWKAKDGKLQTAMSPELCFAICFSFLALPIIAIITFLYQKGDVKEMKKEDYHRHMMNYYKKKRKEAK